MAKKNVIRTSKKEASKAAKAMHDKNKVERQLAASTLENRKSKTGKKK